MSPSCKADRGSELPAASSGIYFDWRDFDGSVGYDFQDAAFTQGDFHRDCGSSSGRAVFSVPSGERKLQVRNGEGRKAMQYKQGGRQSR